MAIEIAFRTAILTNFTSTIKFLTLYACYAIIEVRGNDFEQRDSFMSKNFMERSKNIIGSFSDVKLVYFS